MQECQGIRRYQETDIASLGPEKLIVAAYEALVRDTEGALALSEGGRAAEALRAVGHAQGILSALRGALDHQVGGEIAANLDSLYGFMFEQNLSFLLDRDTSHLRHNLRVLAPLLAAWRRIPPGTGERERGARGAGAPAGPERASAAPHAGTHAAPAPADHPVAAPARSLSLSA